MRREQNKPPRSEPEQAARTTYPHRTKRLISSRKRSWPPRVAVQLLIAPLSSFHSPLTLSRAGYVVTKVTSASGNGKFVVGVCKYLLWPETRLARKVTSSHHLWCIPLLVWGCGGLHWLALPLSFVATTAGVLLTRVMVPPFVNTMEEVGDGTVVGKDGRVHYLNVNLSYEVWKDIKFQFLQITHPDFKVFAPRLVWRWCALNSLVFGFMWAGCKAADWGDKPYTTFT